MSELKPCMRCGDEVTKVSHGFIICPKCGANYSMSVEDWNLPRPLQDSLLRLVLNLTNKLRFWFHIDDYVTSGWEEKECDELIAEAEKTYGNLAGRCGTCTENMGEDSAEVEQ